VENEVKESIRNRLDALGRGDLKTWRSYLSDDCIITGDDGALVKPEDIVKEQAGNLHSGVTNSAKQPTDFEVHVYGDIAVANFKLALDEDWAGQKLYDAYRFTDVLARRGERWLLVSHQETPIPNARRVAVKVDPTAFDAYAGEYRITPNYIIKVKREGDKLMEEWPGDAEYSEDLPVSESTFVSRGSAGEVIFVKDEVGKVTHFILRTASGDLIAKKTK